MNYGETLMASRQIIIRILKKIRMRSKFIGCLVFVFCASFSFAQQQKLLTFNEFKNLLQQYHPVIQQANLVVDNAQQNIRIARAPFDPKVSYYRSQKTYTGKDYYNYQNLNLSVPTWLGVDLQAGYENNAGQFINDEVTLGNSYYVGGSVSLTKGLYMNERRAALEQAKLFRTGSEQERKLILNDLYFDAYASYYKWLKEFVKYKIYSEIFTLNDTRYVQIRNTWRLGKAPAIDTIEARSQLQQYELLRNKSFINWREQGIKLSKHIWDSTAYAQLVQAVFIPDTLALRQLNFNDSSQQYWLQLAQEHPELMLNDLKQDMLRIKQKLTIQELLPDVGVSAYALQSDVSNFGARLNDNNRFGINLSMPLRLSKGRGSYQLNKNQILGTQFKRDFTQRKIENQVLFQLNEINITRSQLSLYDDYVKNIKRLYLSEGIKYRLGSSTVFLINSRENKYLDAKIKQLENTIHYQESVLQLFKEIIQLDKI
jgi:outer membrane protein TolC